MLQWPEHIFCDVYVLFVSSPAFTVRGIQLLWSHPSFLFYFSFTLVLESQGLPCFYSLEINDLVTADIVLKYIRTSRLLPSSGKLA